MAVIDIRDHSRPAGPTLVGSPAENRLTTVNLDRFCYSGVLISLQPDYIELARAGASGRHGGGEIQHLHAVQR
jgi:hypothetical protein